MKQAVVTRLVFLIESKTDLCYTIAIKMFLGGERPWIM